MVKPHGKPTRHTSLRLSYQTPADPHQALANAQLSKSTTTTTPTRTRPSKRQKEIQEVFHATRSLKSQSHQITEWIDM